MIQRGATGPEEAQGGEPDRLVERMREAHGRGDFALLRRLAAQASPETRRQAESLMADLRPDRAAIVLLILCLIFFGLVVWRYIL